MKRRMEKMMKKDIGHDFECGRDLYVDYADLSDDIAGTFGRQEA